LGGNAGEKTGGDAGDEQKGQISKDSPADDQESYRDLAEVMGDRCEAADQPEAFFLQKGQKQDIGKESQRSPGKAIEHSRKA